MSKRSVILYTCGSDLIVDFIEVCLKNDVEIACIINNLEQPPSLELDCVPATAYDFTQAPAPFLTPLFTPRNRYFAVQEALGHQLAPFGLLSDRHNDLPLEFAHG